MNILGDEKYVGDLFGNDILQVYDQLNMFNQKPITKTCLSFV